MKQPIVSVLLPAYNAENYIAIAIESILNQTFTQFELIIIDDCSTDSTFSIIKKYAKKDKRVIVSQNKKNLKLSKTLNKGISLAKGKYIARMDADDWSFPKRLEKQVRFLEKNPDVGIVGGSMQIMDEKGRVYSKRMYPLLDQEIRKKIYLYSPFSHPTIMIRRSILDRAGNYNSRFNPAEDYELYFRIGELSKFANIDMFLIKYRIVANSMTTGTMKNMESKTIEVRKKNFSNPIYKPSLFDLGYTYLEMLFFHLVPDFIKMQLFTKWRDNKI